MQCIKSALLGPFTRYRISLVKLRLPAQPSQRMRITTIHAQKTAPKLSVSTEIGYQTPSSLTSNFKPQESAIRLDYYELVMASKDVQAAVSQTETAPVANPTSKSTEKGIKRKKSKKKKASKSKTPDGAEQGETSSANPAAAAPGQQQPAANKPRANKGLRLRDPVKVPSAESGGVPEPTAEYTQQALGRPVQLSEPRPILVVLDLNGTLLHRPSARKPFNFVERPYATKFLRYCLNTFSLAIWSSARPVNVRKMVEKLLTPEEISRLVVLWSRQHCGLSVEDYDSRVQVYKRLTRLWEDPAVVASHPDFAKGGRWDQSNTVLVDDSLEKGRSEPFNLVPIPEFSGLANEKAQVLPQVHDYLNTLSWQSDISKHIREESFRLDPDYKLTQTAKD